jgi:hypothetical protein
VSNQDLDNRIRLNAVNHEAERLGYRIEVELDLNRRTHAAFGCRDEPVERHCLCRRDRDGVGTAEDGLEILRGVVDRGERWPGGD